MESLPFEIVLDILSRLPINSLLNVKWVCKSWRRLARHPLLASMHFSRMANDSDPCLLLLCDFPIHNHLYSLHFSAPEDTNIETVTRIPVPMIPKFLVVSSCNGLLYLQDSLHQDLSFIYNPFTRDYLALPKPELVLNQQRVAIGFGFHSLRKQYKVVRISYYRNDNDEAADIRGRRYALPQSLVEVLTLGNGNLTWRNKGETSYQLVGKPSQALVNGRIHWLSCRRQGYQLQRKPISFDLEDEQFREVPYPRPMSLGRHCSHLVTLRGCLAAVIHGYRSLYIWVMKEYGVKESWIKEYSIGVQLPRELDTNPSPSIDRPMFPLSQAQVLCLLNNGEMLLELGRKSLVCYDPKSGAFKELLVQDLPERFRAFIHIGSVNWIDTPIHL